MITPTSMIETIRDKVIERLYKDNRIPRIRYATIDPAYTTGRPKVTFDGETAITLKGFPYLASYTPTAGDRVQIINGVIQGKIM